MVERIGSDVGHTVGNRRIGQAGAATERIVSDAGDGQTIGFAGNGYYGVGSRVSSDGDCAIVGDESELGLPHGGPC